MENRPTLTLERWLPLALLGAAVCFVPLRVLGAGGLPRLRALEGERERVDLQISRLSEEIRRLRAEVVLAREDVRAVERVARDQLGLVRRTELVFQFGE